MRRVVVGGLAALGVLLPAGIAGATTFDGSCSVKGTFNASPGFSWNPKPQNYAFDISSGSCTGSLNGGAQRSYAVYAASFESGQAVAGCSPGGLFDATAPGIGVIGFDLDPTVAGAEEDINLSTGPGMVVTPNVERKISGTAGGNAVENDKFNPSFNDLGGCTSGVASGAGVTRIPYSADIIVLQTLSD